MKRLPFIILCVPIITANLLSMVDSSGTVTSQPDSTISKTAVTIKDSMITLTLEELAQYNGKDGKPVYVAVNGLVYDMTGIETWKSGKHKGNKAGTDLSKKIKSSPHGIAVLKKLKVVGKLVQN